SRNPRSRGQPAGRSPRPLPSYDRPRPRSRPVPCADASQVVHSLNGPQRCTLAARLPDPQLVEQHVPVLTLVVPDAWLARPGTRSLRRGLRRNRVDTKRTRSRSEDRLPFTLETCRNICATDSGPSTTEWMAITSSARSVKPASASNLSSDLASI